MVRYSIAASWAGNALSGVVLCGLSVVKSGHGLVHHGLAIRRRGAARFRMGRVLHDSALALFRSAKVGSCHAVFCVGMVRWGGVRHGLRNAQYSPVLVMPSRA